MAVSAWSLAFGVPPANTQLINRLRAFVAVRQMRQQFFPSRFARIRFHRIAPSVVGDVGNVAIEGSNPTRLAGRAG